MELYSNKPNKQVLKRDILKYVAMLTMLLNHTATALRPGGTLLCEIFEDISFTAITMCCFLVESSGIPDPGRNVDSGCWPLHF